MSNTIVGPEVVYGHEVDLQGRRLSYASTGSGGLLKEEEVASGLADVARPEATAQRGLESRGRSFLKAVSWRATALVVTVSVVWVATGEASFAAAIGVVDAALKIGIYYSHERAWNRFSFGRSGR